MAPSFMNSLIVGNVYCANTSQAGAVAGTSVDLLFFPIDTIKTRLQSSSGFLASGGFKGIYKGVGSVALGSAPGAAAFFVTYDTLKNAIHVQSGWQPLVHLIAASCGEIVWPLIFCVVRLTDRGDIR